MAPDKIYVREYQDGYYSTCWDEKPHELAHELESIGMKAVCYIRKDVLMEWIKANLQDRDNWNEKSAADAFWETFDKLDSM